MQALFPGRVAFFLTLLVAVPHAAVLVVDQSGGPGTDFTSIKSAIAAAQDGDVLLVRQGNYQDPLTIDGKSLVLQAEAGASVQAQALSIRNLSQAQSVTVRGLDFRALQFGSALDVSNSMGPVWVEDAELRGTPPFTVFPGGGVSVRQSAAVVLSRCVVYSFEHQFMNPGLQVIRSSVTLHESTMHGVKSFDQSFNPLPGGIGVSVEDGSTFVASNSTIVGGAGGNFNGSAGTCRDGGAGGLGLNVATSSIAWLFGSQILGGPGGLSVGSCSQGPTGPTTMADITSTLSLDPIALGTFVESSPVREGAPITIDVTGEPGAFAWAVYGTTPTVGVASPAFAGLVHVQLTPLLLEPLGVIPPGGALATTRGTTGLVGLGQDASLFVSQLVTFSPTDRRIRVGGGSHLTVLDASF